MRADAVQSYHVDSQALPRQDRFERWRTAIGQTYAVSLAQGTAAEQFAYRISFWQHGRMLLSHAEFSARAQRRDAVNIRRDQVDHYRLILQTAGELRHDADGLRQRVGAGGLLVSDMARTETYEADVGSNIVVFIPRDLLQDVLPCPGDLHGVAPRGALAAVLAQHLRALVQASPVLTQAEAGALNRGTVELLAATLAPCMRTLRRAQAGIESTLLRQACRYVELHLDEADLGVERLCRFFGVSRSALYRWFEPLGGVTHYIRERRLVRAHDALAGARAVGTIGAVAQAHGFSTATQFSRAFREQFGYSPREARARPGAPTPMRSVSDTQATRFDVWLRSLRG